MSNKRVVHVIIACFYREGQGYQENILPKKHMQLGFDTSIVAWDSKEPQGKSYVNRDGIPVCLLPLNNSFVARTKGLRRIPHRRVVGLYATLVRLKPDIIFVHGTDILDNRDVVKYVNKHGAVECYADQHADYYNTPVKSLTSRLTVEFVGKRTVKSLASVSKKLWGVTPWRVQYLHDIYGVSENKLGLLPMGGDEDFIIGKDTKAIRKAIRNQYGIKDSDFLVVTGGKIDRRKHQDLLMEAVCRSNGKGVSLLVFGTPDKEMAAVVENYNDVNNIKFAGWIPSEKAYDMYLASDLAFFPGTHSVLWEQAVACALPIATQHWKGMEHINVNGNAILIDSVTVESILDIIHKCLEGDYYKRLKENAIDVAKDFYYIEIAKKAICMD